MGFFDQLKDQLNPFDGGKSFNSPRPAKKAMQPRVSYEDAVSQAQDGIMNGGLSGSVPGLQSGVRAPLNVRQAQGSLMNGGLQGSVPGLQSVPQRPQGDLVNELRRRLGL
jgi:hypothetical protein